MRMEEAISAIECAPSMAELQRILHRIAQNYGFAAFNYLDIGHQGNPSPYYFGTSGAQWENDYASNGFVLVDPCIALARRQNLPFHWGSVPLPEYRTGRKPGALKTMEAARDHGFTEGLVIPYHFVDAEARIYSALVVFFWRDLAQRLIFKLRESARELHLIIIYWVNRSISLRSAGATVVPLKPVEKEFPQPRLSDRERDVLAWSGRGKTAAETAIILNISDSTVDFHIKNAVQKLNASNRTHAVAKALHLGIITI